MNQILLDAELKTKLNGAANSLEIVNSYGERVGHFLTLEDYVRLECQLAFAECADEDYQEIVIKNVVKKGVKSSREVKESVLRAKSECILKKQAQASD